MKSLIIICCSLLPLTLSAQFTAYWVGGTPGAETDWNEARNWNTQRVPNEDTKVIIKGSNSGHNAMPIITEDIVVAGIELQYGGLLSISIKGTLAVSGEYTYSEGIVSYGGKLRNEGTILLRHLDQAAIANTLITCEGAGTLIQDSTIADHQPDLSWD